MEMIVTSKCWEDDVLKAANKEFMIRGVPLEDQARKCKMRKQREARCERRASKIKAKATYTKTGYLS